MLNKAKQFDLLHLNGNNLIASLFTVATEEILMGNMYTRKP